jgi:hypothetical protein
MKGLRKLLLGVAVLAAFVMGVLIADTAFAQCRIQNSAPQVSASSAAELQNQALANQLLQLQLQRQNAASTSASASSAAPRLTTLQVAPLAVPAPASSSAAASSAAPAFDPLLLTASTVPVTTVCNGGSCGPRLRALTFRPRARSVSRSVSISRTR